VSQSSVDKCFSLIRSPSSSLAQKDFAIAALSRVPGIPDFNWSPLLKHEALHRSLCTLAVRQNNILLITQLFETSLDYSLVEILKPLLSFLDADKVSQFIQKVTPSADLSTLLNSVDLFTNPTHVCLVFNAIRARPLIDVMAHGRFQKLSTALMKMTRDFFDERVATPFDDFALLCSLEAHVPISSLCWDILSPAASVTVPCLFLAGLRLRSALGEFIDSLLALLGKLDATQVVRAFVSIGVLIICELPDEPFRSVRVHFEAAPRELTADIVLALLPSLFAASRFVRAVHVDPIESAAIPEHTQLRDEIVACLRLKLGPETA
jgi:hypothetical protein